MYYELAHLTLPFGTTTKAAAAARDWSCDAAAGGRFLGCWSSDIGALNRLILLRGFDDLAGLVAERRRTQRSADPFGCGELLAGLEIESFEGFDWMPAVRPSDESGIRGPVYEIRSYGIRTGGVEPTIDLWRQYVPARAELSPCVVAMVALDGPLRFTNIWAYPSIDARSRLRAQAVEQGIWPPKGGPAWLTTTMSSAIAIATPVSPLA
jgi:hypothetical protein